jgi:penicillin-binding protein 2
MSDPTAPRRRVRPMRDEDDGEQGAPWRRVAVVRLVVLLVFIGLAAQLLRVQVMQGGRYRLLAQDNLVKLVPSLPARGLIFDRNGTPLVENVPEFSALLTPSLIPAGQEDAVYQALQADLGMSAAEIKQKVSDALQQGPADQPITLKTDINDVTVALKLGELRSTVPALDVRAQPARYYPTGALTSHILGYVGPIDAGEYKTLQSKGYQFEDQIGKTGLEASYEALLRGKPGERTAEVDATGRELRTLAEVPAQPGDNLTLSIDTTLQQGVAKIMADSLNQYHSPSGVAIMMDIHTGEILADVSLPTYDNNLFSGPIPDSVFNQLNTDPGRPLVDHTIQDTYPPGSTFKEITGLAALQSGIATPATTIVTNGKLDAGGSIFPDWQNNGTVDFDKATAMSSDVYYYCLAGGCPSLPGGLQKGLGPDQLAAYARMFGLGKPTGIDLPDEVGGLVPDPAWKLATQKQPWYLGDTYFFGIGQGYVAVTPMQMLRVVAAIANGGEVLRPQLVDQVRDAAGNLVSQATPQVDQRLAISQQNLATMRHAMLDVVEQGSAPGAKVPGVTIGGKSGTAEYGQRISQGSGEEANGTYNESGWFVSFAPYDNPQVALVVFDKVGGGALTAGPTSSKIWDYYFHQYLPSKANQGAAVSPTPAAAAPTAQP